MRVYALSLVAAAVAFNLGQITDPYCKTGKISNEIVGPGPKPHRYACCPKDCPQCLNTDSQCVEWMKDSKASEACCGSRITGYSAEDYDTCKWGQGNNKADGSEYEKTGHTFYKDYCRHIKKSAKTSQDTSKGGSGDTMYFPDCSNGVPPCVLTGTFHEFLKSVADAKDAAALKDKFAGKAFYKDCDTDKGHEKHVVESRTVQATGDHKQECKDMVANNPCDGDAPQHAMDHEMWQQCCAHSDGHKAGKKKVDGLKKK